MNNPVTKQAFERLVSNANDALEAANAKAQEARDFGRKADLSGPKASSAYAPSPGFKKLRIAA